MNKLLVITGASKGIGLATAKTFLENGYQVLNISRSPCELEGVQNLSLDLSTLDWVEQGAAQLGEACKDATQIVLVHNAAMMTKDSVQTLSRDVLARVLQLNVVAAAQLNGLLIPHMEDGSSIVYIGSTLGTKAVANTHAYVVSKHATVGQMRATCQDLAGSQIHTACICPGFTETEMLQAHLGANPEVRQQITSGITLGRLAQPAEIAQTVWFASQNQVINGAVIHANLGQVEH
ncbi:MAG: SDR family oxidoreductase [Gammaproteobacteria bacterium]|nr:SDR family oxidoreductase [Gammaproteobacteria bacterium]